MSRGTLTTVGVFSIAFVVVIIGFFLLDIERVALNYWALASLLFSIAVSLVTTVVVIEPKRQKDATVFAGGLSSTVWIYQLVVIVSIFFTGMFKDHVMRFVFLQIAINALFFIIVMVMANAAGQCTTAT